MIKQEFYDAQTSILSSSWWLYFILGLDFVLLGILVFAFPQLLTWLIASFLLANGLIFLGLAWSIWRLRISYRKRKKKHIIPIQ